jgi:putative DNA primase/helicase
MRFPGLNKCQHNKAAWAILVNERFGKFGDFSSGIEEEWHRDFNLRKQADMDSPKLNEAKNPEMHSSTPNQYNLRSSREITKRHAEAATTARRLWSSASSAPDSHEYLQRKKITAHGVRVLRSELVIPASSKGSISTLQFIDLDGTKRFLKGGKKSGSYFALGHVSSGNLIFLVEGFATGASVYEATGYPTIVAFDSNNLLPVAKELRSQYPDKKIIVCADDDHSNRVNVGIVAAQKVVAEISDSSTITPNFGTERSDNETDFNDLASRIGLQKLRIQLMNALNLSSTLIDEWEPPQPLVGQSKGKPYPLETLPGVARAAVQEVADFTKAPVPMVVTSMLGVVSLAVQGHYDVERVPGLTGPSSTALLTIADSGERKSTCDKLFSEPILKHQAKMRLETEEAMARYRAAIAVWDDQKSAFREEVRKRTRKKTGQCDVTDLQNDLESLEQAEPIKPQIPVYLRGDDTPENLAWTLAKEWPSAAVIASEAGAILGSHGMGKDSIMRNLALINMLWDGGTLQIGRRSSESFEVSNVRFTLALQAQTATIKEFVERSGALARGIGYFARFCIASPESTQGTRFFTTPPDGWPCLNQFHERIQSIMQQELPLTENGKLEPRRLSLSEKARDRWIKYHDDVEKQLSREGEYYEIRDVASKSADNAARFACQFHVFQGCKGDICVSCMDAGCQIAAWYLSESLRFFQEIAIPQELTDAIALDSWICAFCRENNTGKISTRDIQRNVTPSRLRKKSILDKTFGILEEHHRIKEVTNGRRKWIEVHPKMLLKGEIE